MSDNFESSLINLGELSKPAAVLIEKISDAVGGVFKPYLAPICGSKPVDYLVEQWKSQVYIIDGTTNPSKITGESPHNDDAEKAESNNQ